MDFIARQIDSVYIFGRRGVSDSVWLETLREIHQKVDSTQNYGDYYFALRYFGRLITDSHFAFPDAAVYSRMRLIQKTDTIFPVWVKTWTDGTVYCERDYSGIIQKNAQILSVNGHSAQQMALINRSITPSEKRYAMITMNYVHEASPTYWSNFINYLFIEKIGHPFTVQYIAKGDSVIQTVVLQGIEREQMKKAYRKTPERLILEAPYKKLIDYQKIASKTGVLKINGFWGKSILELLIFRKDFTYPSKLESVMARVYRDKLDTLIIDISYNGGGMADNLYKTLNYFTDQPIDANTTFKVTDENREIMKVVIKNSPYQMFGISREQHRQLIAFVDSVPSGEIFSTDTLFDLQFHPDARLKHRFRGKMYLVTSSKTYSAAQQFAQHFKRLGLGLTVGQPCGGYSSISGGNGAYVQLPMSSNWMSFMVPYSKQREDSSRFECDEVDIPIEIKKEDWLNNREKEATVAELIEMIKSNKIEVSK